jgi:hypothetical protein
MTSHRYTVEFVGRPFHRRIVIAPNAVAAAIAAAKEAG